MKVAILDLGTNTFHMLIAQLDGESFRIIHRERIAVMIGRKGISKGFINEAAWKRALDAIKQFKSFIEKEGVDKTFATATSAIRNAKNGRGLTKAIKQETGITVRIITGDEEAELIYYGVSQAMDLGKNPSLIMDIGGGSNEFIIGDREQIFWKSSFEIGAQRLYDQFHLHDPINLDDLKKMERYFQEELAPLREVCNQFKPKTLIGSSGTFDTLSDIYRIQAGLEKNFGQTELPLTVNAFNEIYNSLYTKSRSQRLEIPGMLEMRADMIVVASALVHYVVNAVGIEQIRVSAYALKEGLLLKTMQSLLKSPNLKSSKF